MTCFISFNFFLFVFDIFTILTKARIFNYIRRGTLFVLSWDISFLFMSFILNSSRPLLSQLLSDSPVVPPQSHFNHDYLKHLIASLYRCNQQINHHDRRKHPHEAPTGWALYFGGKIIGAAEGEQVQSGTGWEELIHDQFVIFDVLGEGPNYHEVGEETQVLPGECVDLDGLVVFQDGKWEGD